MFIALFIAVFVPAARAEKSVLAVVLIAILCSSLMYYMPILNEVSSGFAIIICTVIAAALGAILFPREEEENDAV